MKRNGKTMTPDHFKIGGKTVVVCGTGKVSGSFTDMMQSVRDAALVLTDQRTGILALPLKVGDYDTRKAKAASEALRDLLGLEYMELHLGSLEAMDPSASMADIDLEYLNERAAYKDH